jgi:PPM family protein phosphatase
MTFSLHYALRSDVGLLREGNEDSAYAGPRLLAIADGMGGHAAGEVASAVAISAIAPLDTQVLISSEEMLDALASAVASARDTLHEMSESDPAVEGMGTTLTALLWMDDQVAVCHIGDSRAYLLRDGDLYQITRDHTLIQSLVDEGRLSPAAAANHPQRSLIIRALQGSTEADPDLAMHTAKHGDRYLLCSDGLTDVVGDEDVHDILTTVEDADEAVGRLIALAIRNGGPDNITCIVADVVDESGPFPPTRTKQLAGAAANGDARALLRAATGGHTVVGSPDGADGLNLNGHAGPGTAGPDRDDDVEDEFTRPRRRWPLVTSILVVLVLLIAGGLYAGYRLTQGEYYLAKDGGQIAIFRGINEKIAFISLSSVYARTGVPVSHLPGDLTLPTTPTTLAKSQATVASIKRSYTCKQAQQAQARYQAALTQWTAKYGNLAPARRPAAPAKPASPPAYCQALGAG